MAEVSEVREPSPDIMQGEGYVVPLLTVEVQVQSEYFLSNSEETFICLKGSWRDLKENIVLCGYFQLWNLYKQITHSPFVAQYRQIGKRAKLRFPRGFSPQVMKWRHVKKLNRQS